MNILLYLYEGKNLSSRSKELLNIASLWKRQKGGKLFVCLETSGPKNIKNHLMEWPVDKLFFFNREENEEEMDLKKISSLFKKILGKEEINCISMGNSLHERELAPFLASLFHWEFIPNIVEFNFYEKEMVWKRFLYGTRALEEIRTLDRNIVVTISGDIYKKEEKQKIEALEYEMISNNINIILAYMMKFQRKKQIQKFPLETAKIVIGVGKGIKAKENFSMIEKLAELLGATIGVTRSVVDNGWRAEYEQIGQTGRIIKPELYLGFGISGAMQHMAGVQQARHIIIVNNNPNAESFKKCDLGIVADLFEVVPRLITMLENR